MGAGRRRVVVTGMGCVTPLGVRVEQLWENLKAAKSAVGLTTVFDASRFTLAIASPGKTSWLSSTRMMAPVGSM